MIQEYDAHQFTDDILGKKRDTKAIVVVLGIWRKISGSVTEKGEKEKKSDHKMKKVRVVKYVEVLLVWRQQANRIDKSLFVDKNCFRQTEQ